MKTIKFILLAVFAAGIGVACSEDKDSTDETVRQEELRRIAALENALLGQWMEISPTTDGCVISFMDGELIFNRNIYGGFNDTLSCTYQVVSGDLVQIAIGDKSADYKVVVSDNDNIVIKDFIPSDAAVYPPQYADITLKRLSQGEETKEEPIQGGIEGYIVGYETCGLTLDSMDAKGYIVISADLKDTLAVYGMPKIFEFPAEAFSETTAYTGIINTAFPEQFRYAFKMRFTYTLSSEKEVIAFGLKESCAVPAMYPIRSTYRNCVPVIINSAIKIKSL